MAADGARARHVCECAHTTCRRTSRMDGRGTDVTYVTYCRQGHEALPHKLPANCRPWRYIAVALPLHCRYIAVYSPPAAHVTLARSDAAGAPWAAGRE